MADKIIENNQVSIMGQIISPFTFSHQVFGEGFYLTDVLVKRLSDSEDRIPVMISERLIDVTQDYEGEYIQVYGQFRSYNRHEEKKNRLVLSVFAREVSFVEEEDDSVKSNQIFLDGYICKPPVYRKTPLGREIADLLIAVNRPYGKSDYIPCICWGKERPVRLCLCRGRPCAYLGENPEPGIYQASQRDRVRKADGLRGICQQAGVSVTVLDRLR